MITPLASKDAGKLLRSRIPGLENINEEGTHNLVDILGYIPLAITQAAAFIQENSMTIKTYIEELKASDSDLQDYLDENLPDPRRYPDSVNSVTRTWKLSFDQIAKQSPRAADLLSLMVQLDRQAIPKALLKHKDDRSIEFNKAIGILQAYSLIRTEKDGSSFEVHRLIQLSTQRWLSLQQMQTAWQERALKLMVEKFPTGQYGTWKECESLLLHAKCVAKYDYTHDALLVQRALLLENIAAYDLSQGRPTAAYLQLKDVLEIRERHLGKTHSSTLVAMNNLALMLARQGKYTEAETINRQALKLMEEVVGKTHIYTLASRISLARVLNNQGKHSEAETISRHALKLMEEELGKTHVYTLASRASLARVLNEQGKHDGSETMNRQALSLMEEVLGKTHIYTLISRVSLARVLNNLGKHDEAETMNRQALSLMEEVLGKTHIYTLRAVYSFARLLKSKEEYKEATILFERACNGFESLLGPDHPDTMACVSKYSAMLDSIKEGK